MIEEPEVWPPVPLVRLELIPTSDGYAVRYDGEYPTSEQDDTSTGLVTFTFPNDVVTVRRSDLVGLMYVASKKDRKVKITTVCMLRSFKS